MISDQHEYRDEENNVTDDESDYRTAYEEPIIQRRLKYSYGVVFREPFDCTKHRSGHVKEFEGQWWCLNVIHWFAYKVYIPLGPFCFANVLLQGDLLSDLNLYPPKKVFSMNSPHGRMEFTRQQSNFMHASYLLMLPLKRQFGTLLMLVNFYYSFSDRYSLQRGFKSTVRLKSTSHKFNMRR